MTTINIKPRTGKIIEGKTSVLITLPHELKLIGWTKGAIVNKVWEDGKLVITLEED